MSTDVFRNKTLEKNVPGEVADSRPFGSDFKWNRIRQRGDGSRRIHSLAARPFEVLPNRCATHTNSLVVGNSDRQWNVISVSDLVDPSFKFIPPSS